MRRRLLALAGVGALALALAGCGAVDTSGMTMSGTFRTHEVPLPDGSTVLCVARTGSNGAGGVSCDWAATHP